jgi:hypothetical protein
MPRAASTFFQREVFPLVSDFNFKGVDFTFYNSIFQRIQFQDDSYYNESSIRKELDGELEGNVILSNELLVGQSLNLKSTNRTRTAERLSSLFPHGEIVLFLRNQLGLLQSLYSIGVYDGLFTHPEDFIHCEEFTYPTFERNEIAETYKYLELIKLYKSLFNRVEIFLFEDFTRDSAQFLKSFSERMDLKFPIQNISKEKINKSLSNRQIRFLRRLNPWKPILTRTAFGSRIYNNKVHFIEHYIRGSETFRFEEPLAQTIKNYYSVNNLELSRYMPELCDSGNFKKYYYLSVPDASRLT